MRKPVVLTIFACVIIGLCFIGAAGAVDSSANSSASDSEIELVTYTVVAGSGSNTYSAGTVVTCYIPFVIQSVTANPTYGAFNNTVTLTATIDGTDYATCQWQHSTDGTTFTDISGATTPTANVSVSDSVSTVHYYRIVVTGTDGFVRTSSNVTYTSYPSPVITDVTANPTDGALSSTVNLSATVTGEGDLTYQWQELTGLTWTNLTGMISTSVSVTVSDSSATTHTYRLQVSSGYVSTTSSSVTYTTHTPPVILDVTANPTQGALSSTVTLSATVTDANTYQWQENVSGVWTDLTGKTSSSVSITVSDSVSTTHTYRVQATGYGGTTDSASVTYSTQSLPVITDVTANPTDGALSNTVSLSATVSGAISVQWQEFNGTTWDDLAGKTSASVSVTVSDSSATVHTYRIVATGTGGSIESTSVTYTSYAAPVISSVTANPTDGALSSTTTLSATVTDANTYQWQENISGVWTDLTGKTSASVSVTVSDSSATVHTYRLQATGYGGTTDSTSVTYTTYEPPVISSVSANPTDGALSSTVNLSATVTGANAYQWQELTGSTWTDMTGKTSASVSVTVSDSSATVHTYRLHATGYGGTTDSTSVTYTTYEPPVISSVSANPTDGALSSTVNLSATVTGANAYQWQELTGSTWTDMTGKTSASVSVTVSDSSATVHTYRLHATGYGGTTDSASVTYTTHAPPVISNVTANPTEGALNSTFTLSATVTGANTYQWQELNGSTWTDMTGMTSASVSVTILDANPTVHTYRLVATGIGGTTNSASVTYTSFKTPPVISSVSVTPSTGDLSQTIKLAGNVSGADSVQWQEDISGTWTNVTGATNAVSFVIINDSVSTVHTYRLVATNDVGTVYSSSVTYSSVVSVSFKSVSVTPNSGELTNVLTFNATVEHASSYQWQQKINGVWTDISGATTLPYCQEFTFDKDGTYYFRLGAVSTETGNMEYSNEVTYTAGNPSDGVMSVTMAIVIFVCACLLFVFSCMVLYRGSLIAAVPLIASPIACTIITAISAFGKVGDITYLSGVANNIVLNQTVINTISPAVVIIFGFVTALMIIVTIYIMAQVVMNVKKSEIYSEYEDEYE